MQFTIKRETLLKPLQRVAGTVDKRPAQKPILSNVLFTVKNQLLSMVGTDLEIEMVARVPLEGESTPGEITVGGKKLIDICKALPDSTNIQFTYKDNKITLKAGRSRYSLACLSADDFPQIEQSAADIELSISQSVLRQLLSSCGFALSQNMDTSRYYLNGICLIFEANGVRVSATDGHRLATVKLPAEFNITEAREVIIPKKAVFEMQRLFAEGDEPVGLVLGKNYLRTITTGYSFVTKLIEGKFPNYKTVLPKLTEGAHSVILSREAFKSALMRVSALFADKQRGVRVNLAQNLLSLIAVNADRDEGFDEVEAQYTGKEIEIGLKVSYVTDYLSTMTADRIKMTIMDPNSSALFECLEENEGFEQREDEFRHLYVVMPMRI
jgi:DNA polymerase-3 subunit beta